MVLSTAPVPVQLALGLRSLVLVDEDAEMRRRFAYALNAAMSVKGWKAPDLAREIHRDASTVTRWAKGESIPSLFLVKPIAAALSVRPEFLFDPPAVPEYPLTDYLIAAAVTSGVEEGRRRARARSMSEDRDPPAPSPGRRPRGAAAAGGRSGGRS